MQEDSEPCRWLNGGDAGTAWSTRGAAPAHGEAVKAAQPTQGAEEFCEAGDLTLPDEEPSLCATPNSNGGP